MNREHRTISIAEQIFEQLEYDILSGKYKKGEVLSELKLSQELGVSRTPIREALIGLAGEHLLEDTGKGMVVLSISKEEMLDMYAIRLKLEGDAAALAAVNMTDEAIEELGEALDLQKYYADKQDCSDKDMSDNIRDMDSRFHEIIYENCGSRPYCDTLLAMHKKITKYRKASVKQSGRAAKSVEEHSKILEAIKNRDSAKAGELMTTHVRNAMESMKKVKEIQV